MASTYVPALRRKLREAGLQGSLDAGAFKRLLKYVDEVDGSLDELYALIDALKTGAGVSLCAVGRALFVCLCARTRRTRRRRSRRAQPPMQNARNERDTRTLAMHPHTYTPTAHTPKPRTHTRARRVFYNKQTSTVTAR